MVHNYYSSSDHEGRMSDFLHMNVLPWLFPQLCRSAAVPAGLSEGQRVHGDNARAGALPRHSL